MSVLWQLVSATIGVPQGLLTISDSLLNIFEWAQRPEPSSVRKCGSVINIRITNKLWFGLKIRINYLQYGKCIVMNNQDIIDITDNL